MFIVKTYAPLRAALLRTQKPASFKAFLSTSTIRRMDTSDSTDQRNKGNVIGGHKANINNPNTSGQAKQHSQDVLNEIGHDTRSSSGANDTTGKNMGNVVGGYKATLKNPNVSQEAKEHAEEVLEDMGAK